MIYNYAGLPPKQIKDIKAREVFIFENAGVKVNWWDCRPGSEEYQIPPACRHPLGWSNLDIRLLHQAAPFKSDSFVAPLASSFVSETGGSTGTVFCDTIESFARGNKTLYTALLGHGIAHEIGHLLLGAESHSTAGIMKAWWNKSELRQIRDAQVGLLFSKDQAKRLRESLSARQREVEPIQVSNHVGDQ